MARGIRFLKSERESLKKILGHVHLSDYGSRIVKDAASILRKVEESEAAQTGPAVAPIEEALVVAARGKVLPLDSAAYGRAGRMCAAVKATPEDAAKIGAWMARQGWLNQAQTLIDVLNKWYQWLPKARATEPPPTLPAGLGPAGKPNAPDERGPAPAGQAATQRRSASGFR